MVVITVELKAQMATGIEVIYSMSSVEAKNTERARCRLLNAAYVVAARKGINVAACHHGFKAA